MAWMFGKEKGWFYEQDYYYQSYQGKKLICKDTNSSNRQYDSLMQLGIQQYLSAEDMKHLVQYQPIGVAVSSPTCFKLYASGVLTE